MLRQNRRLTALLSSLGAASLLAVASGIGPIAVAAADAPDTCGSATASSPKNTWLSGRIGTASDVDWYRFSIKHDRRVLLTLGDLAADYDLELYSTCSTLVASSRRGGTELDELYRLLPAGTYRVRVAGFLGAHATTPYVLRLRTLAWGIPILSWSTWTDASGRLHIVGEVLNNTAEHRRWIEIDASLRSASGAVLARAVGYTKLPTLPPWSRSPFEIVTRKPTGYASTSLAVCTPTAAGGCAAGQVTSPPFTGLSISGTACHVDPSGCRHDTGTVTNRGETRAHLARAVVTLYDARGRVKGVGSAFTEPASIAVGAAASYDVAAPGIADPNRAVTAATASGVRCSPSPRYGGGQENLVPPLTRSSAAGRVALTFDMGGRMTPAVDILNLLVANHVCATIFPTGSISRTAEGQAALAVVKAHPELFELGNHTMHHCDLVHGGGGAPGAADAAFCADLQPGPGEAEVKRELIDGDAWIRHDTGMPTKPLWRAPYGVSNLQVRTWAAEAGWTKHVKWDIDTIDWRPTSEGGPTAHSMTLKVVNGAQSGSIVLMHLGGYQTLDALQSMIDGLRARGFTLTTVSDLAQ